MRNSKFLILKMTIVLVITFVISVIFSTCSSVYLSGDKMANMSDYTHYGYIIDGTGQRVEGLIQLNAYGDIWMNQGTIGFSPQSEIDKAKANGKTRVRSKWYKAGELQGYGYGDKRFVTKQIELNIGTRYRMLEVLSEQQKTYKFYSSDDKPSDPNKYSVYRENSTGELVWIR